MKILLTKKMDKDIGKKTNYFFALIFNIIDYCI
jgi:hypothetical protein